MCLIYFNLACTKLPITAIIPPFNKHFEYRTFQTAYWIFFFLWNVFNNFGERFKNIRKIKLKNYVLLSYPARFQKDLFQIKGKGIRSLIGSSTTWMSRYPISAAHTKTTLGRGNRRSKDLCWRIFTISFFPTSPYRENGK